MRTGRIHTTGADEQYELAANDFYSHLRSTWERAVEEVAFRHVVVRHRDYIDIDRHKLMQVAALDRDDVEQLLLAHKKCCDITAAHDPSTGRNAAAPPPEELLKDVEYLSNWHEALKQKQKMAV